MTIKKPIIKSCLLENEDIREAVLMSQTADKDIKDCCFFKCTLKSFNYKKIFISGCRFVNCSFSDSDFSGSDISDCEFISCDFSNCEFSGASINRCALEDIKAVGIKCDGTIINNVSDKKGLYTYSNFFECSVRKLLLFASCFKNAYIQKCKLADVSMTEADFTFADFFTTPLDKIDFSKCIVEGICAGTDDLKGIMVNRMQAAELSKIFGIKIID